MMQAGNTQNTAVAPVPQVPHLDLVTMATSLGIILVVFGHALYVDLDYPSTDVVAHVYLATRSFIYTFHMPLFFAISGFLYVYGTPPWRHGGYAALIAKKTRRLIVPYVIISSLTYPIKCLMSQYAIRPAAFGWWSYLRAMVFPEENPIAFFWFLPTLFDIFLVAPAMLYCLRGRSGRMIPLMVTMALIAVNLTVQSQLLPGPNIVMYKSAMRFAIYFWVGMSASHLLGERLWPRGKGAMPEWVAMATAVVTLGVELVLFLTCSNEVTGMLAMAVLGIVATACTASLLARRSHPMLRAIGKYAYQIYLLSWFFQIPIQILHAHRFATVPSIVPLSLSAALGLVGPIVSTCVLVRVMPSARFALGMVAKVKPVECTLTGST